MKLQLRIFSAIAFLLCIAGCTGSGGSGGDGDRFREQMEQSQSLGVWKDGRQIFTFSKTSHQYWCSPSDRTIRIIDNDGAELILLRLDRMPAEGVTTDGTLSCDTGAGATRVEELHILKHDIRNIWLWSDVNNIGLVLPKYGIL